MLHIIEPLLGIGTTTTCGPTPESMKWLSHVTLINASVVSGIPLADTGVIINSAAGMFTYIGMVLLYWVST